MSKQLTAIKNLIVFIVVVASGLVFVQSSFAKANSCQKVHVTGVGSKALGAQADLPFAAGDSLAGLYYKFMQQEAFVRQSDPNIPQGGTCNAVCMANLMGLFEFEKKTINQELGRKHFSSILELGSKMGFSILRQGLNVFESRQVLNEYSKSIHFQIESRPEDVLAVTNNREHFGNRSNPTPEGIEILKKLFHLGKDEIAIASLSLTGGTHSYVFLGYDHQSNTAYFSNPWYPNRLIKAKVYIGKRDFNKWVAISQGFKEEEHEALYRNLYEYVVQFMVEDQYLGRRVDDGFLFNLEKIKFKAGNN